MPPRPSGEGALTTTYLAYGRSLCSEVPLPELEQSSVPAEIFISVGAEPLEPDPQTQRALRDEHGDIWLVVDDGDDATVLSFPGGATFAVDLGSSRITCHPGPDADPAGMRHALLDHVVPRMLVATGSTVLHASGAVVEERAVLFAGPSGAGKSTLAAGCAALGYPVLADDAMVLERGPHGWRAQPSYPGLRLWPDSLDRLGPSAEAIPLATGSSKSRVAMPGMTEGGHPLSAIVLIDRRPGPTTGRRLAGAEAFSALWGAVFAWPGTVIDERLLDRVTALAAEAVVLSLAFPDSTGVQQILGAVTELAAGR